MPGPILLHYRPSDLVAIHRRQEVRVLAYGGEICGAFLCKMSASTEYNADYWTQSNPYYQSLRFNQYLNESQKPVQPHSNYGPAMDESGLMGNYEGHNIGYPFGSMNEPSTQYHIKNEPTAYNTCRFNINQAYSSPEMHTDNSISPPPTTSPTLQPQQSDFLHNLHQFDSCRQSYSSLAAAAATKTLSPNGGFVEKLEKLHLAAKCNNDGVGEGSSSAKPDDSPALRALLTAKVGKKITYDYNNLPNNVYQKLPYNYKNGKNCEANCADLTATQTQTHTEMKSSASEPHPDSGDNLTNIPVNFYPWMKTGHGNERVLFML